MTITTVAPYYEGPVALGYLNYSSATMGSTLSMSDGTTKWGFEVQCPQTGTIDKVGITVLGVTGTPPAYQIGAVIPDTTVDTGYGYPSTTMYSNSTWENFNFPGTAGFTWITLNTPINVTMGDHFYIIVQPGGTPPDGSNYVDLSYDETIKDLYTTNGIAYDSGGWVVNLAPGPGCCHFTSGEIFGLALTNSYLYTGFNTDTDPDEVGVKFTLPYSVRALGCALDIEWGSTEIPTIKIYDGTNTLLWSKTWASVKNLGYSPNYGRDVLYFGEEITFAANTIYRIVATPGTNTSTSYIRGLKYADASYRTNYLTDSSYWNLTYRTNGGAWTNVNTSVPGAGLWVNGIEFSTPVTPTVQKRRVYVFFD